MSRPRQDSHQNHKRERPWGARQTQGTEWCQGLSSYRNWLQQTLCFGQLKNCFTFTVPVQKFFLFVISMPNSLYVMIHFYMLSTTSMENVESSQATVTHD